MNGSKNSSPIRIAGIMKAPMTVLQPSQYFSHWNIGRKYHSGRGIKRVFAGSASGPSIIGTKCASIPKTPMTTNTKVMSIRTCLG